ncbi:MAG: PEP/pyruvate-binding domain-containing protein, partial [Trueperaceae bacterium]|nr:PEP/pyruvate-binding domain-containing protein [Trueperaceae bacterium]
RVLAGELGISRGVVVEAYAQLVGDASPPPPVAVRSSALDEDGPAASFAGQHETILGVVGLDAVLEAIERTWASLRSDVALAYRRDHGLPEDGLALAVLVQRLVVADASGVAFSVDPVSGRRDRMIVNATWGLGESLVAGHVTPDGWTLDKADLQVAETRPSEKAKMTVLAEGRAHEMGVPTFLRERPALADGELAAVATLTRDLEARQGWPIDVEFAVADGALHLLQCRPVTALPEPTPEALAAPDNPLGGLPAPWSEEGDAARRWTRDRVHFPGQLTALDHDLGHLVYEVGLTHGLRTHGVPVESQTRRFWTRFYAAERAIELSESERAAWRERGEAAYPTTDDGLANAWTWRWRPEIEAHLAFWDDLDLRSADDAALLDHLDATYERLVRVWQLHFEIILPIQRARGALVKLHGELFDDASELEAAALLQGQTTLTTRAGEALCGAGRGRRRARPERGDRRPAGFRGPGGTGPTRRRDRRARGARRLPERVRAPHPLPGAERAQPARGPGPRDRHAPGRAGASGAGRPRAPRGGGRGGGAPGAGGTRAAARQPGAGARGVRAAARRRPSRIRGLAGPQLPARLRHHRGRPAGRARGRSPARGRRLPRRRRGRGHLGWSELRATRAAFPALDRRALVADRQRELRAFADVDPPEAVGTPPRSDAPAGDPYAGRTPPETREPDVVSPAPPARAASSAGEPGSFATCATLGTCARARSWSRPPPRHPGRRFGIAAGLVTDAGGVLSHTAVIAREYGLPTVVGTRAGTRRIRDGMLLELDGDRGTVRIVAEA